MWFQAFAGTSSLGVFAVRTVWGDLLIEKKGARWRALGDASLDDTTLTEQLVTADVGQGANGIIGLGVGVDEYLAKQREPAEYAGEPELHFLPLLLENPITVWCWNASENDVYPVAFNGNHFASFGRSLPVLPVLVDSW